MNLRVPQKFLNAVMEKIPTPGDNQTISVHISENRVVKVFGGERL